MDVIEGVSLRRSRRARLDAEATDFMMAGGGPAALHSPGPAPSCWRNKLSFFGIERVVDRALTPVPARPEAIAQRAFAGLLATYLGHVSRGELSEIIRQTFQTRSKVCQRYRAESLITFGSD